MSVLSEMREYTDEYVSDQLRSELISCPSFLYDGVKVFDFMWTSMYLGCGDLFDVYLQCSSLRAFFKHAFRHVDYSAVPLWKPLGSQRMEQLNLLMVEVGKVEVVRAWIEYARCDMVKISKRNDNLYLVDADGSRCFEYEERSGYLRFDVDYDKLGDIHQAKDYINHLLHHVVLPVNNGFSEYEVSGVVRAYFREKSELTFGPLVEELPLRAESQFGGVLLADYLNVAREVVAGIMMDNAYTYETAQKHGLNVVDLLSRVHNNDSLEIYLSRVCDLSREVVAQILESLILSRRNFNCHVENGMLPSPCFVEISTCQVLSTFAGSRIQPLQFMLEDLRVRYPSDWDKEVIFREDIFRKQLYDLFLKADYIKIDKGVKIWRGNLLLTDIDAVVYDKSCNCLALFQLKWQDLFGNSNKRRFSSGGNMMKSANKWVDVVSGWVADNVSSVGKKVGVPKEYKVSRVRLFVIGRNASRFFESEQNAKAAWSNWYNFKEAVKSCDGVSVFDEVYEYFRSKEPLRIGPKSTVVRLGGKVFEFRIN